MWFDSRVSKPIENVQLWGTSAFTASSGLQTVCSVCRVKDGEPVWVLLTSAAALMWWRSSVVASRRSAPGVGPHHHQPLSNLPSSTAPCLHRWWQSSSPYGSVIVSPPSSPLLYWSLRFCFCYQVREMRRSSCVTIPWPHLCDKNPFPGHGLSLPFYFLSAFFSWLLMKTQLKHDELFTGCLFGVTLPPCSLIGRHVTKWGTVIHSFIIYV